jgi:hypothetical protein
MHFPWGKSNREKNEVRSCQLCFPLGDENLGVIHLLHNLVCLHIFPGTLRRFSLLCAISTGKKRQAKA